MFLSAGTSIELEHVGKRFPRTYSARRRFAANQILRSMRTSLDCDTPLPGEFWSVRGVTLSLKVGEALGILGKNGSGKSTLLRLISGFLHPDEGSLRTVGRIASFINLSSGLQPRLNGLENIDLVSGISGRSRSETRSLTEEIIEFSELAEFINAPVETYSSGMKLRLAFAIAVHNNPDILVVDEVLSVGDFAFRQKCLSKVQSMRETTTFLLVSHSANDIVRFCDRAIYLERGQVVHEGDIETAIKLYRQSEPTSAQRQPLPAHVETTYESAAISDFDFALLDRHGNPSREFEQGSEITITLGFRVHRPARQLIIGLPIHKPDGTVLTAVSSERAGIDLAPDATGRIRLKIVLNDLNLNPGRYMLILSIVDGPEFLRRQVLAEIEIIEDGRLHWGLIDTNARWERLSA